MTNIIKSIAYNIKFAGIAAFTFLILLPASGQVVINEICASNSTVVLDSDYAEYTDWVELYNTGSSDIDLTGYYLTDNYNSPTKWTFPDQTIIKAGKHLVIWADGKGTGLHTSFKISAAGEELAIFSSASGLVDSISFDEQQTDISLGRITDGSAVWGYFLIPTPGTSNNTQAFDGFVYSKPDFSIRGGMYSSSQSVALSSLFGGDIRYTLDGSEPLENSTLYTSPVNISQTTVLRARIYKSGQIPGPPVTNTYFINDNSVERKLPVFSIASDPDNFWSSSRGIYAQDFKPDWEIPINIELFENNGSDRAAFNELAGAKINGLYSWQLPQKMLGVYFKKGYGSSSLEYPLTYQRVRNSYKNFALRASGSDWSYTLFRDLLGQHASLLNMDIEIMGFRPSVVYFNGEYMGIHNIREKVDDDYIENSYNLEPGSFDMVENQDFAEAGDLDAYNHLLTLLAKDLSSDANYMEVAELVDIENFTDYVIAEMASGNYSISHNVMAWKPKDSGKWRWILMDLDRGYFEASNHLIDFYISRDEMLLDELITNQTYKDFFAKRLASQMFTSFNATRMNQLIDEHYALIESEVPEHINRWKGTTSSYGNAMPSFEYWTNEVNNLRSFVNERATELLYDLQSYGYGGINGLSLVTSPPEGGNIKINGLTVPGEYFHGPYVKNMTLDLEVENHPGYEFSGWVNSFKEIVIPKGFVWKYDDNGADLGTSWYGTSYNDDSWKSGAAQLGYGDNDETTKVGYGGSSSNKYITTYFRSTFLVSAEQKKANQFILKLLRDDGAIVYLNGVEIIRSNIDYGNVRNTTRADDGISGDSEDLFLSYIVDGSLMVTGINTLAVEIHQESSSSSDISFDLELAAFVPNMATYFSKNKQLSITFSDDLFLTAEFNQSSDCILPELISGDMILDASCSPYLALGDIIIPGNSSLTIQEGVEIRMPRGASIFVEGELNVNGTSENGVSVILDPDQAPGSWGVITYKNTSKPSTLKYLTLIDASMGPDPILDKAAISAFNADLVMDHITIEDVRGNPISARYSDITLRNSSLHSEVTGDLINVKYGYATIENCDFVGNDQVDTDAIDYDEIENGVIRNCRISNFYGTNSDAIDIGEKAVNVIIDSVFAYNITDKGVSIGQRSTARISNSVFINCNMGIALKDSSSATINRCLFYSNVQAVASYEKNLGDAGGNGYIRNSILSNSSAMPILVDSKSRVEINYSLSDNTPLPTQHNNQFGNPLFISPTFFNFELSSFSPGSKSGFENNNLIDMGVNLDNPYFEPAPMIYQVYLNSGNFLRPEFLAIYNPTSKKIDVSGYRVTRGIDVILPEETFIDPGRVLYLTDDRFSSFWGVQTERIIEWESGRLANDGEAIQLENQYGIVIDYIEYADDGIWPSEGFTPDAVMQLIHPSMDNHLGENWTSHSVDDVLSTGGFITKPELSIYPNPTSGAINITGFDTESKFIEVYSLTGKLLKKQSIRGYDTETINLSEYPSGILLIKVGSEVIKVMRQ